MNTRIASAPGLWIAISMLLLTTAHGDTTARAPDVPDTAVPAVATAVAITPNSADDQTSADEPRLQVRDLTATPKPAAAPDAANVDKPTGDSERKSAEETTYKPEKDNHAEIGYIRAEKEIPAVQPAPARGEWYDTLIPDTLDIAQRAELAVHGLTGPLDPLYDYELYWHTQFMKNPPTMFHDWNDWCGVKFWEALALLRAATGSTLAREVDPVWMKSLLRSIGPDGLYYIPLEGRPWSRLNPAWAPVVWCREGTAAVENTTITQVTHPMPIGRVIATLTVYYLRDGNPLWKKTAERMVDRALELMIDKGDYGYLPTGVFAPGARVDPAAPLPTGILGAESYARLIQGPAQLYRATGYEPALRLSKKLTNAIRFHGEYFDTDGRFIADPERLKRFGGAHFHAHTIALLAMLDCALASGDRELIDFVRKSFEWARTQGSATVGFFPENMAPDYPESETCEVADMIALALKLSRAGAGDYWDDADRWIRNQFAENQLTRVDWIYPLIKDMPVTPTKPNETDDRVPERNLGGFAGWPTVNEWTTNHGMMHCCTGNGARTLYYILESIAEKQGGLLKINLLLNRATPWADIDSYIPYEGKVRIRIKQPCARVLVRLPGWIEPGSLQVRCTVNQREQLFSWDGRYIDLKDGQPGDVMTVTFPIRERTEKERIGGIDCALRIKGHTVLSLDPPGKRCPLYQRKSMREEQMSWKPVRRFVPKEMIEW